MINKIAAAKKKSIQEKVKDRIIKAGKGNNLLKIWYTDKKGNSTIRLTEPYEIRGNDYWGYCLKRNSIRRFNVNNIGEARLSKRKYDPRWEVKLAEYKEEILEKVSMYMYKNKFFNNKG